MILGPDLTEGLAPEDRAVALEVEARGVLLRDIPPYACVMESLQSRCTKRDELRVPGGRVACIGTTECYRITRRTRDGRSRTTRFGEVHVTVARLADGGPVPLESFHRGPSTRLNRVAGNLVCYHGRSSLSWASNSPFPKLIPSREACYNIWWLGADGCRVSILATDRYPARVVLAYLQRHPSALTPGLPVRYPPDRYKHGPLLAHLEKGRIKPDERTFQGSSLLHVAASRGDAEAVEHLLERGLDPNDTTPGGTPLHSAARKSGLPAVKALLAGGARADVVDETGATPLHLAVTRRFGGEATVAVVNALLAAGADPHRTARGSVSALHGAAGAGRADIVRLFLERGMEVDITTDSGRTPLHFAAGAGYRVASEGAARLLIEKGADIEAKDDAGMAPLHLAALHGHAGAVKVLLDAGADVRTTDKAGRTASVLAAMSSANDWREAVKLLRAAMEKAPPSTNAEGAAREDS